MRYFVENPDTAMPISEESYADRHARATVLCEEIAGFVPPFTPVDTDLEAAAFDTFCGLVLAANTAVAATFNDWRTATEERQLMVKEIKLTATRVVSFRKSSAQFASRLPPFYS